MALICNWYSTPLSIVSPIGCIAIALAEMCIRDSPHVGLHPGVFLFPQSTTEETTSNPELTILFSQKFTSVGVLLTFNMMSGDYCTRLRVKWYSDGELLSDMEFRPNSVRYFCNNYVRLYDKIVITFYETSRPWRPIFITRIDYGIYRDFFSNELLTTSCLQEVNAISENISFNTLNFTVRTETNIPFDFQKKQKLALYFNGHVYICSKSIVYEKETTYYQEYRCCCFMGIYMVKTARHVHTRTKNSSCLLYTSE